MTPLVVPVLHEERYWYPDDGGIVWVAGYQLVDDRGRYLGREEAAARGLMVAGVAGAARHHDAVLQSPGAAPGCRLHLHRDPANPHDPNAIAVETGDGGRLGWVPRDLAASLAPRLDGGLPHAAVVLRERRASPRDPRTGVTMVLAAAEAIELRNAKEYGR